jgi:putative phage-type endonuclease
MTDREQWLKARQDGIGASDAAAALGLSPWVSPLELYQQKVGEAPLEVEMSDPMRFGTLLEPVIREEYARRTGRPVIHGIPQMRSPQFPWMTANLDGRADDRILECKTARSDQGWGEPGSDDVPQAYLLQVIHQMVVTKEQLADIAVLIGGSDFRIYTVPFRQDLADLVIEGERRFWEAVQRREPPDPTTLKEINLRWRESQAKTVELPPNVAAAVQRLADLKAQIKAEEQEAEQCEMQIKFALEGADTGTIDGVVAVTWKQTKPSHTLDVKALKAARPDVAAEFEVEKPGVRRFLLKGMNP